MTAPFGAPLRRKSSPASIPASPHIANPELASDAAECLQSHPVPFAEPHSLRGEPDRAARTHALVRQGRRPSGGRRDMSQFIDGLRRAPLQNVEINAGIENQRAADERLIDAPASSKSARRVNCSKRLCGFSLRNVPWRLNGKIDICRDASLAPDKTSAEIVFKRQARQREL